MFLTEKPDLFTVLTKKALEDVRIRLLFGARGSNAVIQRSLDDGIGRHTICAKIVRALAHLFTTCLDRLDAVWDRAQPFR